MQRLDPPVEELASKHDFKDRQIKAAGRRLTGSQGFACIKCHTWGNTKATGIQSISMTTMTRRLNEDWFHRYMLEPKRFRPGTRMPAAWPDGQVLLPKVLDGKAMTQINSVWTFLKDGDAAAIPLGLSGQQIILAAFDEAIMYRKLHRWCWAASDRRRVSRASESGVRREQLAARDCCGTARSSTRRSTGSIEAKAFRLRSATTSSSCPTAFRSRGSTIPEAPWPTQTAKELGYKFRGYRLGENRRPTFRYSIGDVFVEDELVPTSAEDFTSVRRTLTITTDKPIKNLWYRVAKGGDIEINDEVAKIDNGLQVKVKGGAGLLRKSGEVLVQVQFENGKATIVQEYEW